MLGDQPIRIGRLREECGAKGKSGVAKNRLRDSEHLRIVSQSRDGWIAQKMTYTGATPLLLKRGKAPQQG
jgi:hypothetical protein